MRYFKCMRCARVYDENFNLIRYPNEQLKIDSECYCPTCYDRDKAILKPYKPLLDRAEWYFGEQSVKDPDVVLKSFDDFQEFVLRLLTPVHIEIIDEVK